MRAVKDYLEPSSMGQIPPTLHFTKFLVRTFAIGPYSFLESTG